MTLSCQKSQELQLRIDKIREAIKSAALKAFNDAFTQEVQLLHDLDKLEQDLSEASSNILSKVIFEPAQNITIGRLIDVRSNEVHIKDQQETSIPNNENSTSNVDANSITSGTQIEFKTSNKQIY